MREHALLEGLVLINLVGAWARLILTKDFLAEAWRTREVVVRAVRLVQMLELGQFASLWTRAILVQVFAWAHISHI